MANKQHKANVHGASVGNGGLADQMAARRRSDGSTAGGDAINGTSIFDPTLCELLVRWYSPPGGLILDPYAGGSVRGIVSGMLGRTYLGVELRGEQVEANIAQAEVILAGATGAAHWLQGDSGVVLATPTVGDGALDDGCDFVMTCPPYADLEIYSRDPADISNMPYPRFRGQLARTLAMAAGHLKPDRFMAVVIGDARDRKTGHYYGLPAHLIVDMQTAGLHLHNWHILATPAGSAPARARNGFVKTRRACLVHQHVLIFVKGDPRLATEAIGPVEFGAFDPLRFGDDGGGVPDLSAAITGSEE